MGCDSTRGDAMTRDFDVIIRGGTIIDGLRTPRFRGDVGIRSGRVAALGSFPGAAHREIDATDLIVAPGFIDMHTHYDSQIFWDPWCSLSGWHGVTSVVIGNCGFGFAPVKPEHRDRAMLTMARNEAVPVESMRAGMPWDWETYPEFLDSLDQTPKGVNVLGYMGLNPIMTHVMGFDAKGRAATADESRRMCQLLREGLEAGACGFSFQMTGEDSAQRDGDGTPMITDVMAREDLIPFAKTLGEWGRGFIQMIGPRSVAETLADVSGRPVIWNLLTIGVDQHGQELVDVETKEVLDWRRSVTWLMDLNRNRGLRVFGQAQFVDNSMEFTFEDWNLFDSKPLWREATLGSASERLIKLSDPTRRQALRDDYDAGNGPTAAIHTSIPGLRLEWVHSSDPTLKRYEGYTVGEIAAEQGKHVIDAMLDIAVADDLKAGFGTPPVPTDVNAMRELVNSDYTIPGVSDGGAHTKFITMGAYTTEFLTKWVRDEHVMDLEQAHWRLSAYPAIASGFTDRGWIKEGSPADIVVYDYEGLDLRPPERTYDFPAGAWRLTRKATGYRYTVVNGEVTLEDGVPTGALPGNLLRHGRN
jgi:N-acyl-D-aspartate/D-glutamate deacylase